MVFLHISCFASPLRIQLVSGSPAMNGDGTRYNPAASHYRFPGMKNISEPIFIQTLIAKASVKTLNKSVLRWLTWLYKP